MSFTPEQRRKGGFAKAGARAKIKADVKEAISELAQRNIDKVDKWLNAVKSPAMRLKLFLDILEFAIPKMARVEHTGKDGEAIQVRRLVIHHSNNAALPAPVIDGEIERDERTRIMNG